ncbi:MAG: 2Fe-2S iron-sulfur cluster-binding protein [Deltaproteobacteria bacterium]|nr:2Fe-2S iron-sulfur cluster-binding protein [Deltaproteobacteria bacterium]
MPKFTIDGKEIVVEPGTTILQAAKAHGIRIPYFCWHPKLSIDGSCRMCQVEVEKMPKLQIACNTPVLEGMVVNTQTPKVEDARRAVMELLLINHPLDCPICDQAGECKLQNYCFDYGMRHSRYVEPKRLLSKRVDIGPRVLLDEERCILCRRCVRFCREVSKTGELTVHNRGDHSVIATFPGQKLDNRYSICTCDICPVGALTGKDFRFKVRVWFLKETPSVCTGCANGCNINVAVYKDRIYRYLPRRNDAVNDTWMCDDGRLSYGHVQAEDRIRAARMIEAPGQPAAEVPLDMAVDATAAALRQARDNDGASALAAVASARATNEDLFVFTKFVRGVLGVERSAMVVPAWEPDGFLIQAEKAPNAAGARAMGVGGEDEARAILDRCERGEVNALIVLGADLLLAGEREKVLTALRKVPTIVCLDTHESELSRIAHFVLPACTFAEKDGTMTNVKGRVQRIRPAIRALGDALPEWEILGRLAARMGQPLPSGEPREILKELAGEVPAFARVTPESVGTQGVTLTVVA